MSAAISRRSVLAALGVGLVAGLAACDSESAPGESTAQPGPGRPEGTQGPTPTPGPPPDTAELLLALARAQQLAATSRAISGAEGWQLTAHRQVQSSLDEQVRVLETLLRAGDVPVPTLSPPGDTGTATSRPADSDQVTATASGDTAPATAGGDADSGSISNGDAAETTAGGDSDSGSAGSAGNGDAAETTAGGDSAETTAGPADRAHAQLRELGRSCLDDVTPEALQAISGVSAPNLPVLIAIAGQRGATASLFDSAPEWADLAGPTGASAAELLGAYRPAVYGFEVLSARSRRDERAAFEQVLTRLRQTTRLLTGLAGEAAPPAPLGYGLPNGTDSEGGRKRLATDLMAALAPTIMGPTQAYEGDLDSVAGTVRLLAEALQLAQPWVPLTGFPGLQVPDA